MKLQKKYLWASLPFLVVSCSLFVPKHETPKVEHPSELSNGMSFSESGQSNFADEVWWDKFHDPILNSLIESALADNNNIQRAIGNINSAKARLEQVHYGWVPTIDLGAAAGIGQAFNMNNHAPAAAMMPTQKTMNFDFAQGGLVPSYTLNIMQQLIKQDIAKYSLNSAKAAKDSIRLAVISQVVGSYIAYIGTSNEIKQQKEAVAHLELVVAAMNKQVSRGLIPEVQVNPYKVKLQQMKAQLPELEHNKVMLANTIKILTNGVDIAKLDVSKRNIMHMTFDDKIPANLSSNVLLTRPDIIQAEEELKIANASIGSARANFFPTIALTSPVGGLLANAGNLFKGGADFWVAQASIAMPVLNLGLYAVIKESKARYYMAYYNYMHTVRSAFSEVDNSFSGYAKTNDSYKEFQQLVTISEHTQKVNQINYKHGYISYPESLSAQIDVDNAKLGLIQMKLRQAEAFLQIYQALGGGYNYKNSDEAYKFNDSHDM